MGVQAHTESWQSPVLHQFAKLRSSRKGCRGSNPLLSAMSHPNLSNEINSAIAKSEIEGGVFLYDPKFGQPDRNILPVGKKLKVQTQNTLYTIEKRGEDDFYISGNAKYCPTPTKCWIQGSNFGGSMLKVGWVGRGMYLEYSTEEYLKRGRMIITSCIQDITEE